ncbi:MAG: patatin-like phospholipase family protein, partial [Jatrophihabitans sp.]|uniref:patatin-like phospholipase family protein n=1 Tax=Jatrophihabitans sp. TaxID=1932789 RepID=UPI003F815A20
GSSAGALNAAWLLCGRAVESRGAGWDPAILRRVIDPRRALRGGAVVDTHHLVHTVYERVVPMDFAAVLANPVRFHPLATDAAGGEAVDLRPYLSSTADVQAALRASTAMPLLTGGAVELAGRRWLDAGLAEAVPVLTALAQGATHLVALRTRRADETPAPPGRLEREVVGRYLQRVAPGAARAWAQRAERYAEAERVLASHPAALQVRPPADAPAVGRTERDPALLRRAVELGRIAADEALAAVLA